MPADVSYLYSVSPPFHSFSSDFYPVQKRATDFQTSNRYGDAGFTSSMLQYPVQKSLLKERVKTHSFNDADKQSVNNLKLKSIITHRKVLTSSNVGVCSNGSKRKDKKVTFADTQGYSLTLTKYLTESTNEPPKSMTSGTLIRQLVKNLNLSSSDTDSSTKEQKFAFKFTQPVANYVEFKRSLEQHNVSLENIVVKNSLCISGTVKVKNLSFDKTVSVRITFDNWKSYSDHKCQYVKNAYENGALDTFQFNVDVPQCQSEDIQMCFQYVCDAGEFWDNNRGQNYVISVINNRSSIEKSKSPVANHLSNISTHAPSTYMELPGPQFNTWVGWEGSGPFY
uniref:protein phosphatase 1 regulatory subunit 3B n=1 Tax=Ciona intestinalis TaxID=7719 RepID=UPI0000524A24|nr:protein phosphatase 1 regulatory subunit 3B [Ciona intestinalis]|eukprot:XP_002121583.1 protein phosphatase 1 regulatory subunit 3B [Ciona intestinalis]